MPPRRNGLKHFTSATQYGHAKPAFCDQQNRGDEKPDDGMNDDDA
jgi:hypothetical protein